MCRSPCNRKKEKELYMPLYPPILFFGKRNCASLSCFIEKGKRLEGDECQTFRFYLDGEFDVH